MSRLLLYVLYIIICNAQYNIKIYSYDFGLAEDFDGIPLPESTDVQPVTQMTPAIVKIGQRYGVPFTAQSLGKKKHKPGN